MSSAVAAIAEEPPEPLAPAREALRVAIARVRAAQAALEMGALLARGVGELAQCKVVDGILKIAAKIWNRVAISKCVARVYSGFALTCVPADDGLTIERVSLVDHPDALAKRLGGGQPMDLQFEKGVKINMLPSTLPAKRPGAPELGSRSVLNEVLPRFKECGAQIERMAKGGQVDPRVRAAYDRAAEELLKFNRQTQVPFRPAWAGAR
jgi:hypothetical protein